MPKQPLVVVSFSALHLYFLRRSFWGRVRRRFYVAGVAATRRAQRHTTREALRHSSPPLWSCVRVAPIWIRCTCGVKDIPFSMRCSSIKASENNWRKSISSSPASGAIGRHASRSPAGNKGNPLTAWRPISLCHRRLKCNSLRGNGVRNLSRLHSASNVFQQAPINNADR